MIFFLSSLKSWYLNDSSNDYQKWQFYNCRARSLSAKLTHITWRSVGFLRDINGYNELPIWRYKPTYKQGSLSCTFLSWVVKKGSPAAETHHHDAAASWSLVISCLVGGLEHDLYFSIYWECHHPNWLIFFTGVETTNQMGISWGYNWDFRVIQWDLMGISWNFIGIDGV